MLKGTLSWRSDTNCYWICKKCTWISLLSIYVGILQIHICFLGSCSTSIHFVLWFHFSLYFCFHLVSLVCLFLLLQSVTEVGWCWKMKSAASRRNVKVFIAVGLSENDSCAQPSSLWRQQDLPHTLLCASAYERGISQRALMWVSCDCKGNFTSGPEVA